MEKEDDIKESKFLLATFSDLVIDISSGHWYGCRFEGCLIKYRIEPFLDNGTISCCKFDECAFKINGKIVMPLKFHEIVKPTESYFYN